MTEPPTLDGLYAYIRRDGQVLLVQWQGGRPVEAMHTVTRTPPKRLTRRRLGDSLTAVLEVAQRRRTERFHRALGALRDG